MRVRDTPIHICDEFWRLPLGSAYFEAARPVDIRLEDGGVWRMPRGTCGRCCVELEGVHMWTRFMWPSWHDMCHGDDLLKPPTGAETRGWAEPGDVYLFQPIENWGGTGKMARRFLPSGWIEEPL